MTDSAEGKHKDINIIVNGEQKTVHEDDLSFDQVVALAYPVPPSPETKFTVTYRKAKEPKHEGILVKGETCLLYTSDAADE